MMGSNATDAEERFFQPFTITTVAVENGHTTKLADLNVNFIKKNSVHICLWFNLMWKEVNF